MNPPDAVSAAQYSHLDAEDGTSGAFPCVSDPSQTFCSKPCRPPLRQASVSREERSRTPVFASAIALCGCVPREASEHPPPFQLKNGVNFTRMVYSYNYAREAASQAGKRRQDETRAVNGGGCLGIVTFTYRLVRLLPGLVPGAA
jgi:hypothetical protein